MSPSGILCLAIHCVRIIDKHWIPNQAGITLLNKTGEKMAYATFDLKSKKVKNIKTKYRTICTPIPHPKSIPLIKKMNLFEPRSMGGQPPIVWHRAKDFTVYDEYGNKWIDFSSGVLVSNCGHLRDEVKEDLLDQINQGLIHNYCFPNRPRVDLVKELIAIAPKGFEKAFLLTTGAESVENALKLARTYGIKTFYVITPLKDQLRFAERILDHWIKFLKDFLGSLWNLQSALYTEVCVYDAGPSTDCDDADIV